jgi:hypothetical protein
MNQAEYNNIVRESAADPAPGPLARALLPDPIVVEGISLRPLVASDFVVLKRLDNALHHLVRELAKPIPERKQPPFPEEDVIEASFLLATPPQIARTALASGREIYRESAMRFGDKLNPLSIGLFRDALVNSLVRSTETWLAYHAPEPKEGEVFTPTQLGAPTTVSAGSSN